jgi:hypothetical protein
MQTPKIKIINEVLLCNVYHHPVDTVLTATPHNCIVLHVSAYCGHPQGHRAFTITPLSDQCLHRRSALYRHAIYVMPIWCETRTSSSLSAQEQATGSKEYESNTSDTRRPAQDQSINVGSWEESVLNKNVHLVAPPKHLAAQS